MNAIKALFAAAVVASTVVLAGCATNSQPVEQYEGYKLGQNCQYAYKELVNQSMCDHDQHAG